MGNSQSAFDPGVYFKDYHFWKEYDHEVTHPKDKFMENFGNGKGYNFYKYVLHTIRTFEGRKNYLVAEEVLKDEDKKILIPFCQCAYHRRPWINLLRYLYIFSDTGCLKSPSPRQSVIDFSKERKNIAYLISYCSCNFHSRSWINPMRYFFIFTDTGCLKDSSPPLWNIHKAMKKRDEHISRMWGRAILFAMFGLFFGFLF